MPTAVPIHEYLWHVALDSSIPLGKRKAIRTAYKELKGYEDALRDHMPELADGDLDDRDLACRLDLRSERNRWSEIIMVLEGSSKTKDVSLIEAAADLLLAA